MNSETKVDINGCGTILMDNRNLSNPLSGHSPVTVGELFKRAELARELSKKYIEAAENMERLAKEGLTKHE